MAEQNEHTIIEKILAGDVNAFSVLVNKYKDAVIFLAYNILLNREDAEEVAQDAFVKAFSCLHTFRADARFSTWLYRIVVNKALNKKKLKKYDSLELTESVNNEFHSGMEDCLTLQITGEHRRHIQHALKSLSVNERLCITLYYLNELSVEEICQLTGITTSHIKVLLFRGRKNLYIALQKHLKGELTHFI